APQVHGDQCVLGQVGPGGAVVLGEVDAALVGGDLGALGHVGQGVVGVLHADAAGHMAVLGDGVLQQVAHHGVAVLVVVAVGGQVVVDDLEGLGAIVVVGVDHSEGG